MHSALLQRPAISSSSPFVARALHDDDLDSTLSSGFILTDPTSLSSSAPDYDGLPPLSPIFPSLDHTSTVSSSPAAMFLSAFSPAVSAAPLPDDEGEQVDGYKLGPIIGFGGFSSIRRAFSPSGGTVAVKIVRRSDLESDSPQARERLENEASIWNTLSHENILPLFHSVHTPYADFFFMLFCPAGTLYDILKRDGHPALPHDDAGMMFRQVVRGVRYLHEQMALVHADLKLENVLVDEMGVCRICDFGMTRSFGEEEDVDEDLPALPSAPHGLRNYRSVPDPARLPRTSSLLRSGRGSLKATGHLSHLIHQHSRPRRRESTPLPTHPQSQAPHLHAVYEFPPGSLPYASPELLRRPDADRPYRPHPAQDIWALGVILYALLTGGLPFVDSFEPRLTMKILHGAFDMPKNVGRGAELVLRGCLEASVPQRWTIAAVDDVSWSVGWGTQTDDTSPGSAENELEQLEQMVHETHAQAKRRRSSRSRSRARAHAPLIVPDHDAASDDAVPELEYDPDPMGGPAFARSTSSRSRSTGPFSPFTHAWSEIEMPPSVGPPELALLGTPPVHPAPALAPLERPRGRSHNAPKCREGGRTPSLGVPRSRSSSVAPLSPAIAEMRGRQGMAARPVLTLGLGLSTDVGLGSKRAGSQPPARSTPWALPSRARASVGVSPALSVAFSTPHADGGFVLKSGVASVQRGRSSGRT
ncbi:kinase-like domain-containing protein [Lactarius hatsudake]|nr:kinase-like domain-containing protein [Lactarius hatsudake]